MGTTSKDLLQLEHKKPSISPLGLSLSLSLSVLNWSTRSSQSHQAHSVCMCLQNPHYLFVKMNRCLPERRKLSLIRSPSLLLFPKASVSSFALFLFEFWFCLLIYCCFNPLYFAFQFSLLECGIIFFVFYQENLKSPAKPIRTIEF